MELEKVRKIKSDELFITSIIEVGDQLFIGTLGNGLIVKSSNGIKNYKPENSKLLDYNINTIKLSPLGEIWIGTNKGLNILKIK